MAEPNVSNVLGGNEGRIQGLLRKFHGKKKVMPSKNLAEPRPVMYSFKLDMPVVVNVQTSGNKRSPLYFEKTKLLEL